MSASHEHVTEEFLLERVLDPGSFAGVDADPELRAARACPTCAGRLREWSGFLDTCRATFVPEQVVTASSADALAQSVLAATTRDDLGWRGDWRLFSRFARARWRSSFLVRVAAASLLLHVAALPVLAYYGLVVVPERRSEFFSAMEAPKALPAISEEPQRDVEFDESDELQGDEIPETFEVDGDELAVLNSIQWARFQLASGAPQFEGEATTDATRLLAARSRLILGARDGQLAPPGPLAREGPRLGASAVVHVLWLDYLLDRFLLEHGVPPEFSGAVSVVLTQPERPEDLVLAAAALGRARSYGLLQRDEQIGLERIIERLSGAPLAQAQTLTGGVFRPHEPLDRVWIAALEAAAGADLARDPVGAAWLAWGE